MSDYSETLSMAKLVSQRAEALFERTPEWAKLRYADAAQRMAHGITNSEVLVEDMSAAETFEPQHLTLAKAAADNYYQCAVELGWNDKRGRMTQRQRALLNVFRHAVRVAGMVTEGLTGGERDE